MQNSKIWKRKNRKPKNPKIKNKKIENPKIRKSKNPRIQKSKIHKSRIRKFRCVFIDQTMSRAENSTSVGGCCKHQASWRERKSGPGHSGLTHVTSALSGGRGESQIPSFRHSNTLASTHSALSLRAYSSDHPRVQSTRLWLVQSFYCMHTSWGIPKSDNPKIQKSKIQKSRIQKSKNFKNRKSKNKNK